ncbi:TPA: hypothetical protein JZG53_004540 [Escherichia coli]|nr:hypothetical protein [Escherichia coli]
MTLIALAVVASAAVSAICDGVESWSKWGETMNMGGELSLAAEKLPWEVKVGAEVKDLNALHEKGAKSASIELKKDIPVLGMRIKQATFYILI